MWQTTAAVDVFLAWPLLSVIRSGKGRTNTALTICYYLLLSGCPLRTPTLIKFATIHLEWTPWINNQAGHLKSAERPHVFTFWKGVLNQEPLEVLENEIFLPDWSVHSSRAKPQMVKEKDIYLQKCWMEFKWATNSPVELLDLAWPFIFLLIRKTSDN